MAKKGSEPKALSWESTNAQLNICRLPSGQIDYDKYRKAGLAAVEAYSKIPLIVYATDFQSGTKVRACQGQVGIDNSDIQGFNEITREIPDGPLDVMIHTPGGSAEAAESIVKILRARFTPIRFIVPVMAKSAGTMIALSGNQILMPGGAELGPIDPQFQISDGAGGMTLSPAQAIIDQFEKAKLEIAANPAVTPAWMPILQRLGTGLLQQCLNGIQLSKTLVRDWVKSYMLAGEPDADAKAQAIVDYLANHNVFYSHGRRVGIDDLKDKGAKIKDITVLDMALWANIERAWYGIQHTFDGTGVFKLFENSRGRTFARSVMVKLFSVSGPPPTSSTTSIPPFDLA